MNKYPIFLSFLLLVFAPTLLAQIPEDCADRQQANGWPEYYCDCKYNYQDFSLPLDVQISESKWFKGNVSELAQGISAYLHSDCEFSFEVYMSCTAKESRYKTVFEPNQANSIDGSTIKRKLEEEGLSNVDASFYICITPINGLGGRLIMRSEADGMPSSCEDPLYMFPGMSLYSTQPTDVYVIDPSNIAEATDIIIHWQGDNNTPCELQLTSNSCDGPLVDEVTLDATNNCYTLTAELLDEAWFNDEKFYLHFNHTPNTAGFVHCLVPEYTTVCTDTTICQGMGIQLADTLLTESTTYSVDTVFLHTNQYRINCLNITVVAPDIQPDTLAFKYTQQPYLYRNQHTISTPGNYDITIQTSGQCDERYALHVYHDIDTVVNVVDTFLCYGASYEYEGKIYKKNTSFAKTDWKNQDTLILDTLNVYFATTPDIVYDTIIQNDYKYGKTFKQTGDFAFIYTNSTTYCVDSIYLHVLPGVDDGVKYDYYYIDTTLCQGMEYEDYYGNLYTTSTVLYDTIWRIPNKHCEIEITTITFTEPEIQYDTISLKTAQLPYKYNKYCTVDTFDLYDYTVHVDGRCDERYQLSVLHDLDTLVLETDTFLCYGNIFVYETQEYSEDTVLQSTSWLNADTLQVDILNVIFASQPIQLYDTLSLESAQLPYQYRDTLVENFGEYELLLYNEGDCLELIYLSVLEKKVTTNLEDTELYDRPRLILYDGVVYILRGSEVYTLLGEKIK